MTHQVEPQSPRAAQERTPSPAAQAKPQEANPATSSSTSVTDTQPTPPMLTLNAPPPKAKNRPLHPNYYIVQGLGEDLEAGPSDNYCSGDHLPNSPQVTDNNAICLERSNFAAVFMLPAVKDWLVANKPSLF
ncbi:uncharacterized protein N7479_006815 [Penicillium vulpinum]|uniref:Uncharacterized protein n=1 Tax=Penicillium vulpinum TaxID=29845 RepID=A0A1V6RVA3_9EURO|nr:uncharacterized protein N7479_006815 [Penicillium vulpinum]KAJ5959665.1 hypothetical protein N7479_006815 [Penicillium vulpinum]OQE05715.1 hypothetical protein PENVUL_c022G03460 [Penicillium vulpinum]